MAFNIFMGIVVVIYIFKVEIAIFLLHLVLFEHGMFFYCFCHFLPPPKTPTGLTKKIFGAGGFLLRRKPTGAAPKETYSDLGGAFHG